MNVDSPGSAWPPCAALRILLAHNYYQLPSGEDECFRAECEILRRAGHEVATYERRSTDVANDPLSWIRTAPQAIWSRQSYRDLSKLCRTFRPDVAHFHNTFPLISTSGWQACKEAGVPVVQTLHNYRLLCSRAHLFRAGSPCHDCVGRTVAWPAVAHRCYRDSAAASALTASMLAWQKLTKASHLVDRFIALTDFARDVFVDSGIDADRIVVKPNFLIDPPPLRKGSGSYALFLGRMSEEKGLRVLMDAWAGLDIPLVLAGTGPLADEVRAWAADRSDITVHGWVDRNQVHALLANARFLVFPSIWYEGMPMVILEAIAAGVPVVASDVGGIRGILPKSDAEKTFPASDAEMLCRTVSEHWTITVLDGDTSPTIAETGHAPHAMEGPLSALLTVYSQVLRVDTHE